MNRDFNQLLRAKWDEEKFLCVGLDPDIAKMPGGVRGKSAEERIVAFNRAIIDATKDLVCAFKPNNAFFEAHGEEGWRALKATTGYIREQAPEVPVILDAKRADIGNTNNGYARMAFDILEADAITVHPYLGAEAIRPFLERAEKGIIVLCRTSNPGAHEFQDIEVGGEPLYKKVAEHVASDWNTNGNCGLVVGATYPAELSEVRAVAPELPFLIPGIGAQGGDLEASVKAGKDADGKGIIVNASRAVLYASNGEDFAEAARKKVEEYNGAIRAALVK
jgi:orotidine-5'-phosphate decarboxylase